MNIDLLKYALKSLFGRKMRTFLTTLSILIGIMAIFALVSFGQGLSGYVEQVSKDMGTNKLIIQPKGLLTQISESGLGPADLDFIKKIKGVDEASAYMMSSVKVQTNLNSQPKYVNIAGLPTDKNEQRLVQELMTVKVDKGRDTKAGDKLKAVLGYQYSQPNQVFTKPVQIGQKIYVNDQKVDIIGFYESLGNPNDDRMVTVTFDGFEQLTGKKDQYGYIVVRAAEGTDPSNLADEIQRKFRGFRGVDKGKEDFTVQTFEELIAQFGMIIGVLNTVLVMIALISVVISAINIMNTMYTSVLERTKDIGIMKAIGAKNRDILSIFVFESGVLGLFGGSIGILLGYLVSSTGGKIAAAAGYELLKPAFPLWLIIGCLAFATIVGAVSGLAPAI